MNYLSVCSGIEAASQAWECLGWTPVAFAEIEKFPSAVLAHHYPNVPNLGDMTKFHEWPDFKDTPVNVVVGGTPCQAFSVAGLREGLNDPRGNLTLTFLGVVKKYMPEFVVWENVPGVLSDETGAMFSFLDGLEELGYVVDVDILDAQFHGVPQRRRRVFVCAQNVEILLRTKTDSSALTIAQCIAEILRFILDAYRLQSESGSANSDSRDRSVDGAKRRMKLFGLQKDEHLWMCRDNLDAAAQRSAPDHDTSELSGRSATDSSPCTAGKSLGLSETPRESPCESWSTDMSWPLVVEGLLLARKLFTTSTATTEITSLQIFTCSKAALSIARLIAQLSGSSPCFWSAASSAFVGLKEFINYARSANSQVPESVERIHPWSDFIGEAESTVQSIGDIGVECFGKISPITQSLLGNPPPSREARQEIAGTLSSRTSGGGGIGTDFDVAGGLQAVSGNSGGLKCAEIAPTLNAHFGEKQGLENQHIDGGGGLFVTSSGGNSLGQGQQERTNGRGHESPDSDASRRFL